MRKPRKSTALKKIVSPSKKASSLKGGNKAPPRKNADDIFGFMAGKVKIVGDIVSPAFTPEEWGDLYPDLPRSRHKPKGSGALRKK